MPEPITQPPDAVASGLEVLDRHFAALNAGDTRALADTLHFPHYRLAGVRMQVWEGGVMTLNPPTRLRRSLSTCVSF